MCIEHLTIPAIITYVFDFHEKRKIKSWVFSKLSVLVLLALCALLATSVWERYQKERETARNYRERDAELAMLEAQAAALEARVAYIESDRGIEAEIRDRYDVVKEGERAVVVMDAEQASPAVASEVVAEEEEGFLSWIFFWR